MTSWRQFLLVFLVLPASICWGQWGVPQYGKVERTSIFFGNSATAISFTAVQTSTNGDAFRMKLPPIAGHLVQLSSYPTKSGQVDPGGLVDITVSDPLSGAAWSFLDLQADTGNANNTIPANTFLSGSPDVVFSVADLGGVGQGLRFVLWVQEISQPVLDNWGDLTFRRWTQNSSVTEALTIDNLGSGHPTLLLGDETDGFMFYPGSGKIDAMGLARSTAWTPGDLLACGEQASTVVNGIVIVAFADAATRNESWTTTVNYQWDTTATYTCQVMVSSPIDPSSLVIVYDLVATRARAGVVSTSGDLQNSTTQTFNFGGSRAANMWVGGPTFSFSGSSLAAGDIVTLRFSRQGGHASDTLGNTLNVTRALRLVGTRKSL